MSVIFLFHPAHNIVEGGRSVPFRFKNRPNFLPRAAGMCYLRSHTIEEGGWEINLTPAELPTALSGNA